MRFPWKRRADDEHEHRVRAELRLEAARADWPKVLRETETIRNGKEHLDLWTVKARWIYADKKAGR